MAAKNRRKIIIAAAVAAVMIGAAVLVPAYLLNQPRLVAWAVLSVLKQRVHQVVFKEITIESLRWQDFDRLDLNNVRVKFKLNGDSYFVSAGGVHLEGLSTFPFKGRMTADVKSMALVSDRLNCSDISFLSGLYFKGLTYQRMETAFVVSKAEWDQYALKDLKGGIDEKSGRFELIYAQADAYQGRLELSGSFEFSKGMVYDMDLRLKGLHTALLAQANPSFAQLTAVVDGAVKVSEQGRGILIAADLTSQGEGSMKASLLRYLVQYVPQRRQVEELIARDADIGLSRAEAKINSVTPDRISSEIILNSSSLNLNMNVKFDINMDGGIGRLFEQLQGL